MKILDIQTYNEKLKINPVSDKEFDNMTYLKSSLKPYDIVRLDNSDYFMFMKGEKCLEQLSNIFDGIAKRADHVLDGIFVGYKYFLDIEDYNEILKNTRYPKNGLNVKTIYHAGEQSLDYDELFVVKGKDVFDNKTLKYLATTFYEKPIKL